MREFSIVEKVNLEKSYVRILMKVLKGMADRQFARRMQHCHYHKWRQKTENRILRPVLQRAFRLLLKITMHQLRTMFVNWSCEAERKRCLDRMCHLFATGEARPEQVMDITSSSSIALNIRSAGRAVPCLRRLKHYLKVWKSEAWIQHDFWRHRILKRFLVHRVVSAWSHKTKDNRRIRQTVTCRLVSKMHTFDQERAREALMEWHYEARQQARQYRQACEQHKQRQAKSNRIAMRILMRGTKMCWNLWCLSVDFRKYSGQTEQSARKMLLRLAFKGQKRCFYAWGVVCGFNKDRKQRRAISNRMAMRILMRGTKMCWTLWCLSVDFRKYSVQKEQSARKMLLRLASKDQKRCFYLWRVVCCFNKDRKQRQAISNRMAMRILMRGTKMCWTLWCLSVDFRKHSVQKEQSARKMLLRLAFKGQKRCFYAWRVWCRFIQERQCKFDKLMHWHKRSELARVFRHILMATGVRKRRRHLFAFMKQGKLADLHTQNAALKSELGIATLQSPKFEEDEGINKHVSAGMQWSVPPLTGAPVDATRVSYIACLSPAAAERCKKFESTFGKAAFKNLEKLHERHAMVNPLAHPKEPYVKCWTQTWNPFEYSRDPEGKAMLKALAEALKAKNAIFEDPMFAADNSSLFADPADAAANLNAQQAFRKDQDAFLAGVKGIQWKRPQEWGNPKDKIAVWSGGIDPSDLRRLGNCYYLAAIASCAQGDEDALLKDLCIEDFGDLGMYGVKFFHNGKWVTVVVDDRIPCVKHGHSWDPIFSSPKVHSGQEKGVKELWPMIFEKAWAKLHLSYEATAGGLTEDACSYLTGGVIRNFELEASCPFAWPPWTPTSHEGATQAAAAHVTLCSARHLPNVDGVWGTFDAFIEFVYKDKTYTSTVKKNSLNPDWSPEEKFEFDLSSGELEDIRIQLKDWNLTSSAKLLGTTVIGVSALKRLMTGDKAAFPSEKFLITAQDGKPLMGKDQQQAHLVLKVAVVKGPVSSDNELAWSECIKALHPGEGKAKAFCSCAVREDEGTSKQGLITGHTYSILKLVQFSDGKKLVQVRNPWGENKWKGDYSDNSSLWTAELKKEAGWEAKEDGAFFMPWEDFTGYFGAVEICDPTWLSSFGEGNLCRYDVFASHWVAGKTAGGPPPRAGVPLDGSLFQLNPTAQMTVTADGPVAVTLFQPDTRCMELTYKKKYSLNIRDVACHMSSVYITDVTAGSPPKVVVDCTPWARQASDIMELRKGHVYHITAATFAPGQEGAFWIAVAGHGVSIEPLTFKYLALPSDSPLAQKMQANYDPYPCCANCHNELEGSFFTTAFGPQCPGCNKGNPPKKKIRGPPPGTPSDEAVEALVRTYLSPAAVMPPITECAFLADVEGNFDYFERYIEISKVLKWKDDQRTALEFKKDNAMFVFGGDSQDKGIGDIRFTKLLLDLKEMYPDRVELIIGNRDANKIRLCSELHKDSIDDPKVLTDASFPYWVEEGKRVTPQMFLDKNDAANTAANRLRWMLKDTMGAEGAFDRRREELSIIKKCKKDEITDAVVVASYRDECDPKSKENFMLQYLQKGKLAYVFGSTMFVHGGLSVKNIGTVPGKKNIETSVQGWVKELNDWAQKEVKDFIQDPYSGKNARNRKGDGLTNYGSGPNGNDGATVVYTHCLENGNSKHIPKEVQKYLLENRINTVLCGHQPHGDCPNVICTGSVKVIIADTSYSQMGSKSSWGVDNRGVNCVSEVIVNLEGSCEVHGKLADGTAIAYKLGGKDGDRFVGRQLSKDKSWIKAKLAGKPEYVACLGEGFKLTQSRKTEKELNALKATDFVEPEIVTEEGLTSAQHPRTRRDLELLVELELAHAIDQERARKALIAWHYKASQSALQYQQACEQHKQRQAKSNRMAMRILMRETKMCWTLWCWSVDFRKYSVQKEQSARKMLLRLASKDQKRCFYAWGVVCGFNKDLKQRQAISNRMAMRILMRGTKMCWTLWCLSVDFRKYSVQKEQSARKMLLRLASKDQKRCFYNWRVVCCFNKDLKQRQAISNRMAMRILMRGTKMCWTLWCLSVDFRKYSVHKEQSVVKMLLRLAFKGQKRCFCAWRVVCCFNKDLKQRQAISNRMAMRILMRGTKMCWTLWCLSVDFRKYSGQKEQSARKMLLRLAFKGQKRCFYAWGVVCGFNKDLKQRRAISNRMAMRILMRGTKMCWTLWCLSVDFRKYSVQKEQSARKMLLRLASKDQKRCFYNWRVVCCFNKDLKQRQAISNRVAMRILMRGTKMCWTLWCLSVDFRKHSVQKEQSARKMLLRLAFKGQKRCFYAWRVWCRFIQERQCKFDKIMQWHKRSELARVFRHILIATVDRKRIRQPQTKYLLLMTERILRDSVAKCFRILKNRVQMYKFLYHAASSIASKHKAFVTSTAFQIWTQDLHMHRCQVHRARKVNESIFPKFQRELLKICFDKWQKLSCYKIWFESVARRSAVLKDRLLRVVVAKSFKILQNRVKMYKFLYHAASSIASKHTAFVVSTTFQMWTQDLHMHRREVHHTRKVNESICPRLQRELLRRCFNKWQKLSCYKIWLDSVARRSAVLKDRLLRVVVAKSFKILQNRVKMYKFLYHAASSIASKHTAFVISTTFQMWTQDLHMHRREVHHTRKVNESICPRLQRELLRRCFNKWQKLSCYKMWLESVARRSAVLKDRLLRVVVAKSFKILQNRVKMYKFLYHAASSIASKHTAFVISTTFQMWTQDLHMHRREVHHARIVNESICPRLQRELLRRCFNKWQKLSCYKMWLESVGNRCSINWRARLQRHSLREWGRLSCCSKLLTVAARKIKVQVKHATVYLALANWKENAKEFRLKTNLLETRLNIAARSSLRIRGRYVYAVWVTWAETIKEQKQLRNVASKMTLRNKNKLLFNAWASWAYAFKDGHQRGNMAARFCARCRTSKILHTWLKQCKNLVWCSSLLQSRNNAVRHTLLKRTTFEDWLDFASYSKEQKEHELQLAQLQQQDDWQRMLQMQLQRDKEKVRQRRLGLLAANFGQRTRHTQLKQTLNVLRMHLQRRQKSLALSARYVYQKMNSAWKYLHLWCKRRRTLRTYCAVGLTAILRGGIIRNFLDMPGLANSSVTAPGLPLHQNMRLLRSRCLLARAWQNLLAAAASKGRILALMRRVLAILTVSPFTLLQKVLRGMHARTRRSRLLYRAASKTFSRQRSGIVAHVFASLVSRTHSRRWHAAVFIRLAKRHFIGQQRHAMRAWYAHHQGCVARLSQAQVKWVFKGMRIAARALWEWRISVAVQVWRRAIVTKMSLRHRAMSMHKVFEALYVTVQERRLRRNLL